MIIAIDFDGTISDAKFPLCNVTDLAKLFIPKWRRRGHKVILWTCRDGDHLQQAIEACRACGIEFDAVNDNIMRYRGGNSRKVWADVYIDDKVAGVTLIDQWYTVDRILKMSKRGKRA